MPERSPAYAALVAKAGIDPALRRVAEIAPKGDRGGQRWLVRMGEPTETPHGTARMIDADPSREPIVDLPDALEVVGYWSEPAASHALAVTPKTPEEHWARVAATDALLAGAGVSGSIDTARGWLPILEAVVQALSALGVSGGRISHKEKFGTLRLDIHAATKGDDLWRYLSDLAEWAEAESTRRCMATGAEGRLVEVGGWWYTLSEEARALDRRSLMRAIYPDRP